MRTIFSLKGLAACWAVLLVALGSGLVVLQLSTPPLARPTPVILADAAPVVATPQPAAVPLPFENRSLLAMLPPPRPPIRPVSPLPVPPVPPAPPIRHVARAEPRRPVTVYAAEPAPAYDPVEWGRAIPYPSLYARARPYAYPAPQAYYGW